MSAPTTGRTVSRTKKLGSFEVVERFQREARAAAGVHHHNVVAVYDSLRYLG